MSSQNNLSYHFFVPERVQRVGGNAGQVATRRGSREMVYGGVAGATRPCSGPYHIREVVGEKCEYTLIYDPLYVLLFRRRIVLKQKNVFVGVNLRISR